VAAAKVTLASGTAATKLSLDSEGSGIIAEFAAPLGAKETLTVVGVTDGAQAPNEMTAATAQVASDWPSNRAGLSYLWQNAQARNVIMDEQIGLPITTALSGFIVHSPPLPARVNRFGAATAVDGAVFAPFPTGFAEARLAKACVKSNQFSFEIVVASTDLTQTKNPNGRPLFIFQWGHDWGNGSSGQFWLLQEKNLLQVVLAIDAGNYPDEAVRRLEKPFDMATLPDTKPHHLIVSYAPKRLAFYLDGKKVKEIDPLIPDQPAQFGSPHTIPMYFGDPWYNRYNSERAWRGTFEYVAMYSRFIEEPEAAKNAAAVAAELAKRKALPRIEVQATLVAKSKIPDPGQMAPYRNALIVNEYSVEKVLNGTYAGKTIRVAQWGMLDLKPTPLAAQEPGASVKLVLETFADHDELVPELISDTLKEDFDLKLYTDVNL
jgi:hypothetical protein